MLGWCSKISFPLIIVFLIKSFDLKTISLLSGFMISLLIANAQSITGSWKGILQAGSTHLTLVFHIDKEASNGYQAHFDSPDQHAFGIPCSGVRVTGDSLEILIQAIHGGYRGKWDRDNNIEGIYFQSGQEFPLALARSQDTVMIPLRPQTPKPPFPYKTEELEYNNPAKGVHLAGTLTLPNAGGPFPAAILITGSGQQDRDETLFGHKPFAVIADYLTRRGYAVLRVDDRQMGKSTGDLSRATTLDFVEDVETSFRQLQQRKDINQKKIGLIGHSEGGLIAAMLASENSDIDYIVLLAGPGLKGADLLAGQTEAYDLSLGAQADLAKADKELKSALMGALLSSADSSIQFDHGWQSFLSWKKNTPSEIVEVMGLNNEADAKGFVHSYLHALNKPWMIYFLQTDPAEYLGKLKSKVLALNGSRDIQVIADPNLSAIESALKKSPSKSYQTQKIPDLNHLFQHCKTCTVAEYGELEETFSPQALQLIGDWLDKNVK